jgi:hypothetical protein
MFRRLSAIFRRLSAIFYNPFFQTIAARIEAFNIPIHFLLIGKMTPFSSSQGDQIGEFLPNGRLLTLASFL